MKKIVLMAALLLSLSASAQDQQRGQRRQFEPKEMATRQAQMLKDSIGINDEQYKKVYELFLKSANEMQAEREKMQQSGDRPQFDREAWQKRNEAQNAELKKIITEEQYDKYQQMQQRMRQRGFRGQGRRQQ